MVEQNDPQSNVFGQNICISCGVCNTERKTYFDFDTDGYLKPVSETAVDLSVCPMISQVNEDDIARENFHHKGMTYSNIGYYDIICAARLKDVEKLKNRSSGGIISSVLESLLKLGKIDAVATVFPHTSPPYFRYRLVTDPKELEFSATSAYYPVEMSKVLAEANKKDLKIAITGLPCGIKGLNLLIRKNPEFEHIIKYKISLICGHIKTANYLKLLSHQLEDLEDAKYNFRGKDVNGKAKQKFFQKHSEETIISKQTNELYGGPYNYGYFQYEGCNYCDDIIGETSDLSVGDAWLDQYVDNNYGMSLCVSRNKVITDILETSNFSIQELKTRDVITAQAGGYRQRREGLAYRLSRYPKNGLKKRSHLLPKALSRRQQARYDARYKLSHESHLRYKCTTLDEYAKSMQPLLEEVQRANTDTLAFRIYAKIRREINKILQKNVFSR